MHRWDEIECACVCMCAFVCEKENICFPRVCQRCMILNDFYLRFTHKQMFKFVIPQTSELSQINERKWKLFTRETKQNATLRNHWKPYYPLSPEIRSQELKPSSHWNKRHLILEASWVWIFNLSSNVFCFQLIFLCIMPCKLKEWITYSVFK